jgi:hypothetical protein
MQTPRAHRTTELMKEIARQGHAVTVYAVLGNYDYSKFIDESGVEVKNIPIKWMWHPFNSDGDGKRFWIDKILGKLLGKKFLFPNFEFYYAVQRILKMDNNYDVVISIAEPHQIHWGIAKYRTTNPSCFPNVWIADCGDPFVNNDIESWKNKKYGVFEHLFCKHTDFITVPEKQAVNGYFLEYHNKIRVIPQGFDFNPKEVNTPVKNSIPTFAYAGTFYADIRNPKQWMEVLCRLPESFKFIVYTNHSNLIDKYKEILGDKLDIRKGIPRDILLIELKKMDFLVNLNNENSPNQIPSKLIDYAITGRPILNVNPSNVDVNQLEKFMNGDFKNAFIVSELNKYRISSVVDSFFSIIRSVK